MATHDLEKHVKASTDWIFESSVTTENTKHSRFSKESFWLKNQEYNKNVFVRLPVSGEQCSIGTEIYPNAGISVNY